MSQEWVAANLKNFEYEDLQELDSLSAKIRYSAIGSFLAALYPQYNLINSLNRNNPISKSFKVKVYIGVLILLPFACSNIVSLPFKIMQENLIEDLKVKYSTNETN